MADQVTVTGMVLLAKFAAFSFSADPALRLDTGAVTTGATVSIVTLRAAELGLTLPAASTAWAMIAWLPSASTLVAML